MTAAQIRAAARKLKKYSDAVKCHFCGKGKCNGFAPVMVQVHGRCLTIASARTRMTIQKLMK